MSKNYLFILVMVSILFLNPKIYSQYLSNDKLNGDQVLINQKPGHIYQIFETKDGKSRITDIDLTEEMDIIVEFKDEPMFIKQKAYSFSKISAESYQKQVLQFTSDFNEIGKKLSSQLNVNLKSPQIKETYYKIFNGVCMSVPRAVMIGIKSLSYVKKIHENYKVQVNLKESIPLINVDSVWRNLGNMGDSIVVAVIDGGIDYNHPALGRGFGKGHKVIGGYDFGDNDNDPMDDHGHGTHVAGIIAGDGDSIKGVAPKALLMAYKVFDKEGFTTQSTIITAIERTVDPNQDGNSKDKIDIVNMSLGGPGDCDDALSTAVDNTTKQGVVFVIAAGNTGRFSTITSPGAARLAITVGATDKFDKIANFSSMGPNRKIFGMKPDIVAPGVNVYSSIVKESYAKMSGTSMATPMVAGVCALIKKSHPNWTPEEIKSALMNSTKDLGYESMIQGSGRIDAYKAVNSTTTIVPFALDLGRSDNKQAIWEKEISVSVKNDFKETQQYSVNIPNLIPGILIIPDKKSFQLAAGNSTTIKFKFTIDNNIVPFPGFHMTVSSNTHWGSVLINGTRDSLKVPWSFVKFKGVHIKTDQKNQSTAVTLIGEADVYEEFFWENDNKRDIICENGKYTVFVPFLTSTENGLEKSYYLMEDVIITDGDTININQDIIKNSVSLIGRDNNGTEVFMNGKENFTRSSAFFYFRPGATFRMSSNMVEKYKVSDFSNRIKLSIHGAQISRNKNTGYIFDFGDLDGLNNSVILKNDYTKLIPQKYSINIPDLSSALNLNMCISSTYASRYRSLISSYYVDDSRSLAITNGKYDGIVYLSPSRNLNIPYYSFSFRLGGSTGVTPESFMTEEYYTNPIVIRNDSVGFQIEPQPYRSDFRIKTGQVINFSEGLFFCNSYFRNNTGNKKIFIWPTVSYYGFLNEWRPKLFRNSTIKIFNEANIRIFDKNTLIGCGEINVPPGKYRTEIENTEYFVKKQRGKLSHVSRFNLASLDPNPPVMTSFQIRDSNDVPITSIKKNEKARILFSAIEKIYRDFPEKKIFFTPVLDDSTQVYVKVFGTKEWNTLRVNKISEDSIIGCYYSADISEYINLDSSALDIKLVVYGKTGNSFEYTLEPAVAVGRFEGKMTGIPDEENIALGTPKEYKLNNNYPNPFNPATTISYSLPEKSKVKIEIFNILGQEVTTLTDEIQEAGNYKLEWNAKNYSSGLYLCRMSASGKRNYEKVQKLILMK